MSEGFATVDWLVIGSAAALGFGVVRFAIVNGRDRAASRSAPSAPTADEQRNPPPPAPPSPPELPPVSPPTPPAPASASPVQIAPSPLQRPWHVVLEVSPQATAEEVLHAYQRKWRDYDPAYYRSLGEDYQKVAERARLEVGSAYSDYLQRTPPMS